MYTLNERVFLSDCSMVAVKTTIYGIETYAVLVIDNDDKLIDVNTCMSEQVAVTKLACRIRAHEYSNLQEP